MRRALAGAGAAVVLAVAALAATACSTEPGLASPNRTGTVRLSVPVTPAAADPRVTRQVCAAAVAAAGRVVKLYNEQLATLERAAALGDEDTMMEAAEAIIDQVTEMASAMRALARKAVTPRVRTELGRASAKLAEITSESYAGSPADIRKTLVGLGTSLSKACG